MSRTLRPLFLAAALTAATLVAPTPLSGSASGQTTSTSAESRWVSSTLASMTLEEKVGQLFVVNAAGISVDDPDPAAVQANRAAYGVDNFAQLIAKYRLGGIIYFGGNTVSPAQVLNLSNGIQQVARSQRSRVPILISTDQEGGLVVRLNSPAAVFPGNMALGATRDLGLAYQNALVMGQELRAVGINTDLAPVVDVNTNPLNTADGARAYGDQTSLVSNFTAAQVRGFQNNNRGVAATAKHFPGLGSSDGNTDLEPVTSNRTLSQLRAIDLPPFWAAVQQGTLQVMTSHLRLPNVDPSNLPASLSPTITTGLLRNELRYDGVAITDGLQAAAVTSTGLGPAGIAVAAVKAGNDQLLETMPGTGVADLDAAYNGVLQAVRQGQISQARLNQSVTRVLRAKYRLGLVANPFADPARLSSTVGTPDHLALAQTTAERSITLLKNQGVLPLRANTPTRVLVAGWNISVLPSVDRLAAAIAARGVPTTKYPTGFHPTPQEIGQAVAAAQQADVVVASLYNGWAGTPNKDQITLIQALVGTGKPVVVVEQNAPYDAAYVPGVAAFVSAWSYQPVSLNAAVRVIFGEVNPRGLLPITIRQPPPSTAVLYPFGYGLHY